MPNKYMTWLFKTTLTILVFISISPAAAQREITFYTVALDPETRTADKKLKEYLELYKPGEEPRLSLSNPARYNYEDVIRLLSQDKGSYLARTTPYVYVVAEMLGAKMEVLAAYLSKATDGTTYHSYFVVNRNEFDNFGPRNRSLEPQLDDLVIYLKEKGQASQRKNATFIYHNKFSTSSFFVPSLFFRDSRIYSMKEDSRSLIRIHSELHIVDDKPSSTNLVKSVATENSRFAAVWDGTKSKFEKDGAHYQEFGDKVYFIKLPTTLPNDLLVCSASLADSLKAKIRNAISGMAPRDLDRLLTPAERTIGLGDYQSWVNIKDRDLYLNEATAARYALNNLRRLVRQRPAPVVVQVTQSEKRPVSQGVLEAAEQAIRLSGSEFIQYEKGFHQNKDYIWTLEETHDKAVLLRSEIERHKDLLDKTVQTFQISFEDSADLTKRIGNLIHSRLHRIRYLWPYQEQPTLIRDVAFSLQVGDPVTVERIQWLDPRTNEFDITTPIKAKVANSDFSKFQLEKFNDTRYSDYSDPLSNVAYRVVLIRPSQERLLFTALTWIFVALFVMAAIASVFDIRRRVKRQSLQSEDGKRFENAFQERIEKYHGQWCTQQITAVNLLWCNRERIEQLIEELKTDAGLKPDFARIRRYKQGRLLKISLPIVKDFIGGAIDFEQTSDLIVDPAKVGDTARVGSLIRFLATKQHFSSFTGKPLEWDVLNTVAGRLIFNDTGSGENTETPRWDALLQSGNPELLGLISRHYNDVLDHSLTQTSFFRQTWQIENGQGSYLFTHKENFNGRLQIKNEKEPVDGLLLEFNVPSDAELQKKSIGDHVHAWLLGKINHRSCESVEGGRYLRLHFRATALVRED